MAGEWKSLLAEERAHLVEIERRPGIHDDARVLTRRFDKIPRIASHTPFGVIELMPTSDLETYAFKYVNGHPSNPAGGHQTVTAFGVLADVANGYPTFWSEMTVLTAPTSLMPRILTYVNVTMIVALKRYSSMGVRSTTLATYDPASTT